MQKQETAVCNNTDGTWEHYAKRSKIEKGKTTSSQLLKKNYRNREQIDCCQRWEKRDGKTVEGGQKIQIPSYKINKSWGYKYSMVTIVNNIVLYIQKLLRT